MLLGEVRLLAHGTNGPGQSGKREGGRRYNGPFWLRRRRMDDSDMLRRSVHGKKTI